MKSRIIIRVFGGLGNQLFIYAYARSLSLNLNREVCLDTRSGFPKDSFRRKYLLDNFNIKIDKASIIESLYFPLKKRFNTLSKILFLNTQYLTESVDTSDLLRINENKSFFLEGYWQNTKYFDNVSDIIRQDLGIKSKISNENELFEQKISEYETVAVHVRRLDYTSRLPLSYYYDSLKKLDSELTSAHYYIFSDDINWCKMNLKFNNRTYFIEHNNGDELQDLWLMSKCKNFIIANSTFSWWAAWLSTNKKKLVIKPTDYLDFNFPTLNA